VVLTKDAEEVHRETQGLMHALELFDKRNESGMIAEEICEISQHCIEQ
jgi:hypothetical protein